MRSPTTYGSAKSFSMLLTPSKRIALSAGISAQRRRLILEVTGRRAFVPQCQALCGFAGARLRFVEIDGTRRIIGKGDVA